METIKLNLGAGSCPLTGYVNLDRKTGQEVFPLSKYADESVDEVRSSHVLEHFSHRDVGSVLHEWTRVLKPGGLLKVAVPDFYLIARQYLAGENVNVQGYVMGGHVDDDDLHGALFDKENLAQAMKVAGLREISRWQSDNNDCASLPCSLNLMGRKAGPVPKLNIECAMSVPRLGFQDNFFCWAQALPRLGIKPTKYDGAFWGQCLERVMSDMLHADWILTVDYDSVFTAEHVESLIRLADEHPEADALAAVQTRRKGELPLLTKRDEHGNPVSEIAVEALEYPLYAIDTAHFGLTMLRVSALKKMPHPWFLGVPDKDGTWGDDRTDDDIYFWKKWKETGNSLYLANRVVIGHGEFVVTWPDREGGVIHQHPSEFWDHGAPEGVWE